MMKDIRYKIIIAVAVVAAVLSPSAQTRSSKSEISKNLNIFSSVYRAIQMNYVDSIDASETMKNGINAMLYYIDPYNEYYPANEQDDLLSLSTGEFGGIGSYILQDRQGRTVISKPQPGTPSANAGLRPGDIIWTIDGDTVLTLGSAKVRERLRGEAGTSLKVTVKRPYPDVPGDSMLTFDIVRAAIPVKTISYTGVVRDSIGYIGLTEYNEQAPDLVREALVNLKKDPRVKGIVLDLSNNGGGLLESAVKIVGLFVPRGTEVVRTRGGDGYGERIYRTTNTPVDTKIPLAVIINGNSASSSEITAGALQDLDRAVIIGERSFGKGLVQSTFRMPEDGILKVTVARYYIPSGRLIQALDYSHRNPDGSAGRVPDSLTNVYHTRAGREVRDGGGITPDIKPAYPETARLTYNIVTNNSHFDFATLFHHLYPDLNPDPATYELPDSVYAQFKEFIDPATLNYDKVCESYIDNLRKAVKVEGYESDEVTAALDSLAVLLHHDLNHDLDTHRKAIEGYLVPEILDRYDENGGEIYTLRNDPDIDAAVKVLTDPARLKEILSAPKPEEQ